MRTSLALGWDELAQEQLHWATAIDALERATASLDANAGQRAIADGSSAARRIGELTGGRPDAVLQSRWVNALLAWQNRGSALPKGPVFTGNESVPWWVWIALLAGIAVATKGRGSLSW